jgi:predicted AAA+ superfamily ATPase
MRSGDKDAELISQLKCLNETLKRLADAVSPVVDDKVFDRFHAFKVQSIHGMQYVKGIADCDPVRMRELKGIDDIVGKLKGNTEQFLGGLPCNKVL